MYVKPGLVVGGGDVKSSKAVYDQICLEKITLADIGNRVGGWVENQLRVT